MEKPAVKMSKTAPLPSTDFEDYSCLHVVKVSDFGMARRVEGGLGGVYRESSAPRIPIRWTAPECVDGHVYSERSDVWAWAVTAWELFADGSPPFQDIPTRNVHAAVKAGVRPTQPACCPDAVYSLLMRCWELDPQARPTFDVIVEDMVGLFHDLCGHSPVDIGKQAMPSHQGKPPAPSTGRPATSNVGCNYITDADAFNPITTAHPQPNKGTSRSDACVVESVICVIPPEAESDGKSKNVLDEKSKAAMGQPVDSDDLAAEYIDLNQTDLH
eukprot:comp23973_c3_seq3/m.42517 comp23973_c3_seq3/g.42517  ORF comp23973_c3_seq3/g.42517 comp23973_c3_seq3/m.42517 type:complete len:272 (-) comp23973_c3_seq3:487-1302(-)